MSSVEVLWKDRRRRLGLPLSFTKYRLTEDIIGIFDLDNASVSRHTRAFLRAAEDEGMVLTAGEELPKSLVVCCPRGSWQRLYISPLAPATLVRRAESGRWEEESE